VCSYKEAERPTKEIDGIDRCVSVLCTAYMGASREGGHYI
jgi:hypothetical protein